MHEGLYEKFCDSHIDKIKKNDNSFLVISTLSHYTAFVYIDFNFCSQRKENRSKQILKISEAYSSLLAMNRSYSWLAVGRL